MPRIPTAAPAGAIQHRRAAAPIEGVAAPRSAIASAIDRKISDFADNAVKLAGSTVRFVEKLQQSTDSLAAADARNLFSTINGDLESRMDDNPGKFEEFAQWAADADRQFAEQLPAITSRMSSGFRKHFEKEMTGRRTEAFYRRNRIISRAKVTANYNRTQALFKDAAGRGDLDECRRLLEEQKDAGLISPREYDMKLNIDLPRLADSGAARRDAETDPSAALAKLREKGPDGRYSQYPAMDEEYRDKLIRYATADDAKRRADENEMVLNGLNNGEMISEEDVRRKFDGKNSPEDVRQMNQQLQILRSFTRRQQIIAREERTAARQEQRLEKLQRDEERKRQLDFHEYSLLSHRFPADPAARQTEYNRLKNEIFTQYAGDGPAVKRLLTQLNENFKATSPQSAGKIGSSYKNSYVYKHAMSRLDGMKKDFDCYRDVGAWRHTNDNTVMASNFQMMKVKLDEFLRNNPGASAQDAEKFIEESKKFINAQAQQDLVAAWNNLKMPKVDKKINIPKGDVVFGYEFLGGDPKDKKNWKKK